MTPHRAALKAETSGQTQTHTLTPGGRPVQLATLQIPHTPDCPSCGTNTHSLFKCELLPCERSYLPSAPDWLSHWTQPAPPRPTAPGSRPQRDSSLCDVTAGNMFHKVVTKEM